MHSSFSKYTLLGFTFSLVLSNSMAAEQRHYPSANQTPIVVGTEEYNENYTPLAGLEGVHVSMNTSYDRLETTAFGESRPLSYGTSEKDHAIYRRSHYSSTWQNSNTGKRARR